MAWTFWRYSRSRPVTCLDWQHEFLPPVYTPTSTHWCASTNFSPFSPMHSGADDPKLIHYRKLFEQTADPLGLSRALLNDSGKAVGGHTSEASALFARVLRPVCQLVARAAKSSHTPRAIITSPCPNWRSPADLDDPAQRSWNWTQVVKDQKNLDATS